MHCGEKPADGEGAAKTSLSRRDGRLGTALLHWVRAIGMGLLCCWVLGNSVNVATGAGLVPPPETIPPAFLYETPGRVPYTLGAKCQLIVATYDSKGYDNAAHLDLDTWSELDGGSIEDMVIDKNGRTITAGWATCGGSYQFLAAGIKGAGGVDRTFGGSGVSVTDFTRGTDEFAYAVAIDKNDRIVIAGGMYYWDGNIKRNLLRFALARYKPDGTLDSTFAGGDGKQITNILAHPHECITDIAVDNLNRIVAAGWAYKDGHFRIALVRYKVNGEVDPTFGSGGTVLTDLSGAADVGAVAVGFSDGQIIVAAQAGTVGGARRIALVFYDETNGAYQGASFKSTSSPVQSFRVNDMVIDDGNIIVVGTFEDLVQGTCCFFVGKSTASGQWDPSFGKNGIVFIDFDASKREEACAVDVYTETGNIAIGGFAEVDTDTGLQDRFAVAKLKPNGTPVTTFGNDGRLLKDMPWDPDERALAICAYTYEGEEGILAGGVGGSWGH